MLIARSADGWLTTIVQVAVQMRPLAADRYFAISPLTMIMLSVQEEPKNEVSWHVRWMTRGYELMESHHCTHPLMVIAAVAAILEKAEVKI